MTGTMGGACDQSATSSSDQSAMREPPMMRVAKRAVKDKERGRGREGEREREMGMEEGEREGGRER